MRALVVLLLLARTAAAEPSNGTLVGVGLAMAPPTYLIGVTLHEGSHALAAKLVGATVDELHLFPPGEDPHAHVFRFGWTYVHGLHGKGEHIFFLLAPKITDAVLMGGFAALVFSDVWPHNRYGQLALTVGATGLWVDYSKDLFLFSTQKDVGAAFDLWCMHGWKQLPARLLYGATIVGFGLVVAKGYFRTFDREATSSFSLPVVSGSF